MSIQISTVSNANLYLNGKTLLGKSKSIEINPIKVLMEDHDALAMVGKIELPVIGIDKVDGSIEMNGFYEDFMSVAANPFQFHQLQARSSVASWSSQGRSREVPLVTFLTVQFKEYALGKFEQHKKPDLKHDINILYVKQIMDGREIIEYDALGNILRVAGQDVLEQYRLNVGA